MCSGTPSLTPIFFGRLLWILRRRSFDLLFTPFKPQNLRFIGSLSFSFLLVYYPVHFLTLKLVTLIVLQRGTTRIILIPTIFLPSFSVKVLFYHPLIDFCHSFTEVSLERPGAVSVSPLILHLDLFTECLNHRNVTLDRPRKEGDRERRAPIVLVVSDSLMSIKSRVFSPRHSMVRPVVWRDGIELNNGVKVGKGKEFGVRVWTREGREGLLLE